MKKTRGQKSRATVPLRTCRQGNFYVFIQAPSFNLQKYTYSATHKRKKLVFFPKISSNISFLPLKKFTFHGRPRQACRLKLTAPCPLPPMGIINHWHFPEQINCDMPSFNEKCQYFPI
jgi:hypothetical protein